MKKSATINTLKNYKWQSVFVKYWLWIFTALMIPVICIFFALTNHYDGVLNKQFEESTYESLFKIRDRTDDIFKTIVLNRSEFSADSNNMFKLYCVKEILEPLQQSQILGFVTIHLRDATMKNLNIDSVYFLGNHNNYVLSTDQTFYSNDLENFSDGEVFAHEDGLFKRTVAPKGYPEDYITYKENVSFLNALEAGTLVYNISCSNLLRELEINESSGFNVYFAKQNGDIIFTNDKNNNLTNINMDEDLKNIFASDNATRLEFNKSKYIAVTSLPSYPISIIIKGVPDYYATQKNYNQLLIWAFTLLSLILAVLLSLYITSKFYNSIYDIVLVLQDPQGPTQEKNKNNELLFIKDSIISIVEKNKQIEKELDKRLMMLNEAQGAALEAQLNPHFLFNTLQLINVLERSKEQKETDITKAINLLADLLRYALDTTSRLVPLKTEIEYNKKYMAIQNLKFGNSFDTIWNISPETLDLKVLKFSIQPILENAISYGISQLNNVKGFVVISSEIKKNKLVITITDNGTGIPKEKLTQIRKNISEINLYKKNSIGLSNINQRIRLIFGDDYNVKIASDETGTKVTLTFPVVRD